MYRINRIFVFFISYGLCALSVNAALFKDDLQGVLSAQEIHAEEYSKTVASLKAGAYGDAQTEAEKIVANNPGKYPGHLLLLLAYLGNENFVAIEKHLQEVERSVPRYVPALRENLFRVLQAEHRYYRALILVQSLPTEARSAQLSLDMGKIYLAQSKYADAVQSFSQSLKKNSSQVEARYELGRTLLIQGKYQLALDEFLPLVKASESPEQLNQLIGVCYLGLGDYSNALKYFNDVIKKTPDDVLANLNSGIVQLYLNDNEKALAYLLASQKKDKTADSIAGQVLTLVNLNKQAEAASLLASLSGELTADPLVQLAGLSIAGATLTSQAREAIGKVFPDVYFVKQDELDFTAAAMYKVALAALLYKQGIYTAVAEISAKESAQKKHPLLALVYARAQIKTNQVELAITNYRSLESEHPGMVSPRLELAEAYYHQQKYADAIAIYKTLPLESNLEWKVQLGNLYNANQQYEFALNTYTEALAAQRTPYIVNQIAATYSEKLEQPAKAIRFIDEAKISQPSPLIWDTLGWAYFNVDQLAKSLSAYKQLMAATGNNQSPETFSKMARAYEKNGDIKQSRILYEMALNTGHDFEDANLTKNKLAELDARSR